MAGDFFKDLEAEIAEKLAGLDIELVDLEYHRENKQRILRIFIDTATGADLETCSNATRALKDLVEAREIEYDFMEVSSPGLDRVLKKDQDLARFQGFRVKVKTVKQYEGHHKIKGILRGHTEAEIMVETEEQGIVSVPRNMITIVRLEPDY